jgi:hypothetical protein
VRVPTMGNEICEDTPSARWTLSVGAGETAGVSALAPVTAHGYDVRGNKL